MNGCMPAYKNIHIRLIKFHVGGPVTLRRCMLLCHLTLNMRVHCYVDAIILFPFCFDLDSYIFGR